MSNIKDYARGRNDGLAMALRIVESEGIEGLRKEIQKVYTNDCMVESCEFAESKNASQQNTQSRPEPMPQTNSDGFMKIPDGIDEELQFN